MFPKVLFLVDVVQVTSIFHVHGHERLLWLLCRAALTVEGLSRISATCRADSIEINTLSSLLHARPSSADVLLLPHPDC